MKVLLMHEHGRSYGAGAITAMYRLHTGLKCAGVQSMMACRKNRTDALDIFELPRADFAEDWIGKFTWRLGLNDIHCVSSFKIKNFQPFLDADVVNIHGLHSNYFNYLALPGLARRKPVILTMHDMWTHTGHCSQSYECERWKTGCGKCPHLDTFPPVSRDGTAIEWRLKNWVYKRSNLTFVAPSRWLLDLSRQSMFSDHDLRQIPNPVDETVYKPLDKMACRARLGLPQDKHVIMFVSVAIQSWAKGGDLLVKALEGLPRSVKDQSVLLLLGERGDEFGRACNMPAIALGYIHEDDRKAEIYSAADVMVQPSRAENQSMVVLEALACGTPAIGFDVGGNEELINAGPGGVVVAPEDHQAFGRAIQTVLEDRPYRESLARGARQSILDNYTLDLHVQRYVALYQEKIEQRREATMT